MTLDMQTILNGAPPIGFKKDQFTPFGKWLVDSKDRDAHIARQAALQALDEVNAKITEMIEDARSEIATDTGLTDEERTQGECTIYDLTALGAWIEDRMEEITQCLT